MGRASDAPVVASAGTQAEPRTPASWLRSADRSQTAAPLPVGSDPRSVRRTEPLHKCSAAIWIGSRIASPEMFPEAEMLPHLICSRPIFIGGANDEADQHGGA